MVDGMHDSELVKSYLSQYNEVLKKAAEVEKIYDLNSSSAQN